jgi:hypothetical protein
MKLQVTLLGAFLAVFSTLSLAAAPNGCAQGSGEYHRDLPGGNKVDFAPLADGSGPAQCRGAITTADGTTVFEITAPEVFLNEITGTDINGDGKTDVVIESHRAHGQCCFTYSVVTPELSPALVKEITTSVPLNFEERDGAVQITGHDNAFMGFDGLPDEFSPSPLVIFRMRGSNVYYVGQAYWHDYELDLNEARNSIPRSRLDKFKGTSSNSGGGINGQQKSDSLEGRELYSTKGTVLQIVLDYLYGGKGQEAWKALQEMWAYPDYLRVRQLILQARSRGLMSEVNRQPAKPHQQAGVETQTKAAQQ